MRIRVPSDVVSSITDSFAAKYPSLRQGKNSDEVIQAMLETMRFFGVTNLRVDEEESLRYSFSKEFAPFLVSSNDKSTGELEFRKVTDQLDLFLKNKITLLEFEFQLALQFLDHSRADDTLMTLDIIENMDPGSKSKKLESVRSRAIGIKEFLSGNISKSMLHFKRALEIGMEIDDTECVAGSYLALGNVYASLGENEQANTYHENAFLAYNEIGNIKGMGRSKNNLAFTCMRMGLFKEAIHTWKEAIDLLTKANDQNTLQLAHLNMGELMTTFGYYKDGLESAMDAYQLSLETGNKRTFHLARVMMTTIDIYSRKHPPSKRFIVEALQYMKQLNFFLNVPYCYEALALYHIYSGNSEMMLKSFKKAISGYAANADTHSVIGAGITFMRTGIIYKLSKKDLLEANIIVKNKLNNKKDWDRYRSTVSQFFPDA